ncbi:unnamed protein product [Arctia plantaginis]|uniref:Uncharacterized protein n=1 Tax=Arctia plantaginis TaxID=874455 RepID=A0A8S0ZGY5_ARCPL|nr:unnamed protein product [Arctia plantaginis]
MGKSISEAKKIYKSDMSKDSSESESDTSSSKEDRSDDTDETGLPKHPINKSVSVSSSLSLEDSFSIYGKTVPPIPERQEVTINDIFKIFDDFRTKDPEIDPEIFRDDFNSHIEVIDRQKSQLNFKRDGFYNTPKLNKKTTQLRNKNKHSSVTRTIHYRLHKTMNTENNNDLLVNNKVNIPNPRKSHSLVTKNISRTQSLNDLEPKIRKSKQRKHKPIAPISEVSDVFSTYNTNFLSNLKKSKNSKEYVKSEPFNKLVNKRKNKLPRLNKRRKPRNRNDSENRHEKRKYSGIPIEGKEYNKVRHIQPELDIALEQAELPKEKQHKTQNKKGLLTILRSLTTDFVTSKTEMTADSEVPIVKNVNDNSKPHKDEFTLGISDTHENQGQSKTEDLSSHLGSSLLDMDVSMYQHILGQEPKKVSSVSKDFQNKKAHSLKSTLTSSLIVKQQPVKGINDKSEIEPYDQLDEKVESDKKVKDFALGINSNAEIDTDKAKLDTIKPENTILRQADYKNDDKPYTKYKPHAVKRIQPKIAKKNFDASLTMNDRQDKITNKEDKVDLDDDFSKAEIVLTDSKESDEISGDGFITVNERSDNEDSESVSIKHLKEDKGIGNVLRYSRRGIRSKKLLRKCHRACIGAYTSVCRRLKCSPKAKRDFKYQCRKSCKRTFGKRKYSSSEK